VGKAKSGLEPLLWINQLITVLEESGVTTGWAFQNKDGLQIQMRDYEDLTYEKLMMVQDRRPDLLLPDVKVTEDLLLPDVKVTEDIGLARSFRRGATSRAQAAGVDGNVI
jgi:hypothetical protein